MKTVKHEGSEVNENGSVDICKIIECHREQILREQKLIGTKLRDSKSLQI